VWQRKKCAFIAALFFLILYFQKYRAVYRNTDKGREIKKAKGAVMP
jgi:hypothetical protein